MYDGQEVAGRVETCLRCHRPFGPNMTVCPSCGPHIPETEEVAGRTPLTREEIEAIRASAEAATEGPWCWESVGEKINAFVVGIACDEHGELLSGCIDETGEETVDTVIRREMIGTHEGSTVHYEDATFIAYSRTDVPHLCDDLLDARESIGELEAIIRDIPHLFADDNTCYYCREYNVHRHTCLWLRAQQALGKEVSDSGNH